MWYSPLKHSGWHVLMRNHTVYCHPNVCAHMEWAILPLLPSRRALPHFGQYSFPVLHRVGGWVAWVAGCIPRWFARLKMVIHPSTKRAWRRVTSLYVQCRYHYIMPPWLIRCHRQLIPYSWGSHKKYLWSSYYDSVVSHYILIGTSHWGALAFWKSGS